MAGIIFFNRKPSKNIFPTLRRPGEDYRDVVWYRTSNKPKVKSPTDDFCLAIKFNKPANTNCGRRLSFPNLISKYVALNCNTRASLKNVIRFTKAISSPIEIHEFKLRYFVRNWRRALISWWITCSIGFVCDLTRLCQRPLFHNGTHSEYHLNTDAGHSVPMDGFWRSFFSSRPFFCFRVTFGTLITARENCFIFNKASRWTDIDCYCCFMMALKVMRGRKAKNVCVNVPFMVFRSAARSAFFFQYLIWPYGVCENSRAERNESSLFVMENHHREKQKCSPKKCFAFRKLKIDVASN